MFRRCHCTETSSFIRRCCCSSHYSLACFLACMCSQHAQCLCRQHAVLHMQPTRRAAYAADTRYSMYVSPIRAAVELGCVCFGRWGGGGGAGYKLELHTAQYCPTIGSAARQRCCIQLRTRTRSVASSCMCPKRHTGPRRGTSILRRMANERLN